jgi:hypothetical protein
MYCTMTIIATGHLAATIVADNIIKQRQRSIMEQQQNPVVNPWCAQQPQLEAREAQMGPQSQRRLTLIGRMHRMQESSNRKRKGDQLTLFGDRAFQPEQDCVVCKARLGGRDCHKAHHKLCPNNKRTGGKPPHVIQPNKIDKALALHFKTRVVPKLDDHSRYSRGTESTHVLLSCGSI